MSESLKPCPFCGGEPVIQEDADFWYVACMNKDCRSTTGLCDDEPEARTSWNRRASPASPAIVELIDCAEELVEILDDPEARKQVDGFTAQPMRKALAALRQQDAAKENHGR